MTDRSPRSRKLSGFSGTEHRGLRDLLRRDRPLGLRVKGSQQELLRQSGLSQIEFVRNDSDIAVPANGVLTISGMAYDRSITLTDDASRSLWSGQRPEHHCSAKRLAITLEPLAPGESGPAVTGGFAECFVDVSSRSHTCARPVPGKVDRLVSSSCGAARLTDAAPDPDELLDPDPGRWSLIWLEPGGLPIGSVVCGLLQQPLPAATGNIDQIRPTTALLQVFDVDPLHELTDDTMAGYRFDITGITPGARGAALLTVGVDVGYRVTDYSPVQIVGSTGRDGDYTLAPSVTIDGTEYTREWDAVNSIMRLPVVERITEQLDDGGNPIVDGSLILPGAHQLIGETANDSVIFEPWYELVSNSTNQSAALYGTCLAVWDGRVFQVVKVNC